jgi:hypothetical protein
MNNTPDLSATSEAVMAPIAGTLCLDSLDRRTRPYRRYQAINGAVLVDLGGEDQTSEIQRQLVSRFATLALSLEAMEASAIEGSSIDLDLFARGAGHLRRIGEALGMKRTPRDVTGLGHILGGAHRV